MARKCVAQVAVPAAVPAIRSHCRRRAPSDVRARMKSRMDTRLPSSADGCRNRDEPQIVINGQTRQHFQH